METRQNGPFSFPEVRVVEASAGSGKTYALAKRYVQLLINPSLAAGDIPLRQILAITFTNKATVEMKERILEFLKKIALDAFTNKAEADDLLSSLGLPVPVARKRAFAVMDHLIHNYNFFQVQTIDSFVNAIVAGCAFSLHLSSRFEIKTGYRDYLAYSLDSVIDRSLTDRRVRGVLADFLQQYLHVENRLGWFPKKNILTLVEELYTLSNTYGGEFVKFDGGSRDDLFALKNDILGKMRQLRERLPAGTNKKFVASLDSFFKTERATFSVEDLSNYFTYERFPGNKGAEIPPEVDRLWDGIRHAVTTLCRYEAYSFYNCYIDIFSLVAGDFRSLSRDNDVIFLPELNRRAGELFAGGVINVPELYYRLAARFKHFLIDEFQDTSSLQWKNLLPLVEEALASGGSLFYVGDKKQAIYRFRGGDATLFERIPRSFAEFHPAREVLGNNYRSHREIVEFNNEIFSAENLRRFMEGLQEEKDGDDGFGSGDIAGVLEVFADSRQNWLPGKEHGYVKVQHVPGDTVEGRNAVMRDIMKFLVQDLHERYPWRDIAVLARDNNDVELLTSWLLEDKVPVESEKTLNVRENALVKELVSLLTFLNSPIDDLSFASFLLGDIFLKAAGRDRGTMESFLFEAHGKKEGGYLYRGFREAHQELWDTYFEEFFVNVGYVPLYELVVSILGRFRVMDHFPEHQAFIMRFLEIIARQEEESGGLVSFLDYFKEADDNDLYVNVTETDSLKVLTIHKSKGLEFPVVIIPFLEMQPAVSSRSGSGSFELGESGEGLSLVRLNKKYARYSPELQKLYAAKYRKSFIDELDAVYVALTRARSELYAYVPPRASSMKNPVRLLIPGDVERGTPQSAATKEHARPDLMAVPPARYENWIALLKDEFTDDAGIKNREKVQRGEFLHYALSHLGNLEDKDPARELQKAVEKAKAMYPMRTDAAAMEATLRAIVESAATRYWYFVEKGTVHQEKEVVDAAGATRRIDRLIVTPSEATIIDYKSSPEGREAHGQQVREYMKIIGTVYPDRKVRGFVLYLDTVSVEEIQP